METIFQTRFLMAGWLFLGIMGLSLWLGGSPYWTDIEQLVLTSNSGPAIAGAVVAFSVVGIAPVIGFAFERFTGEVMFWAGLNQWKYKCVQNFGRNEFDELGLKVVSKDKSHQESELSRLSRSLFHSVLYGHASDGYIDWLRGRRTQSVASLTGASAIIGAILLSTLFLNAFSPAVLAIGVTTVIFLTSHGIRQDDIQKQSLTVWIETEGHLELAKLAALRREALNGQVPQANQALAQDSLKASTASGITYHQTSID